MVPKTNVYFENENLTLIILIHSLCIRILFTIQAKTDILTKPWNTSEYTTIIHMVDRRVV